MERYYIDLNKCLGEDFSEYEFDENGIPLSRFFRNDHWKHNPITVCQYGLHFFNKYFDDGNDADKNVFLAQAHWLIDNAKTGPDNSLIWTYLFNLPFYEISKPWISGMAQGEALSVLVRAHSMTGNEKFLNAAQKVWKIFRIAVEDGGVIAFFPDSKPVIEEYPKSGETIAVLNGFIFAMLGIYDFAEYTNDNAAKNFFSEMIDSLKGNLFRYDSGYWSYYDLKSPKRLTSQSYHRLHIEQLKQLFQITQDQQFRDCVNRFQNYQESLLCKVRWTARKLHQKIILRI